MTPHYYECHITIDPVEGERLDAFKEVCKKFKFRVADLLKQNGDPSKRDSFCTGHDSDYAKLVLRMAGLCDDLTCYAFSVRRAKIEAVLFDTKQGDSL